MNYKDAGVDISRGNEFVNKIGPLVNSTRSNSVLTLLGGFNGFFDLTNVGVTNPVLVASTDGVGTKLKLATQFGRLYTIGIDLVAMVVNDIITSGATPLFFLDYYATGKLDVNQGYAIMEGIVEGCRQSNISLIGGETAEMPLMYSGDDFDLAGFGVGIVDKNKIINPSCVKVGDVVVGLASSGVHSNGFSLINKLNYDNFNINEILKPTKIYVNVIKNILEQADVHGIAHITGGGITENVPRVLPYDLSCIINKDAWEVSDIFRQIQKESGISEDELFRVYNCGCGMVLIVDPDDVDMVLQLSTQFHQEALIIGNVIKRTKESQLIYAGGRYA